MSCHVSKSTRVSADSLAHSLPEAKAAVEQLVLIEPPIEALEVNERGYGPRKKKGKPISKQGVVDHMIATSGHRIGIVGPDFIGVSTVLQ